MEELERELIVPELHATGNLVSCYKPGMVIVRALKPIMSFC